MKFGIYLPNFGPFGDARLLADLAQDAEQAGWDGFFIWDHIAGWKLPMVDPWVALAAIAMNTSSIRIGTMVTPIPRRRPWKLARETVSIDHLSNGRLTLGVGIGTRGEEWDHLGEETELKKRGQMLDEALDLLMEFWSGESFNYEGKYYQVAEAQFLPRPVQQPHIPIWVAGYWPNKPPFRRAAKWDGVFPLFQVDEEAQELNDIEKMVNYIRERCTQDKPFDFVCMGMTPDNDPEKSGEMIKQRAARGATWWLECIAPFRYDLGYEEKWPLDSMRNFILKGPP